MKFFHGGKGFIVEEGDCIYFNGSIPHYGVFQRNKEVKCLMVIPPPRIDEWLLILVFTKSVQKGLKIYRQI
jgi:hypothetical protein